MQQVNPRLDPAPSRWSYRMQRLMLTPLYRNLLRIGLPFAIAFGSVTLYMSDDQRRETLVQGVVDLREQFQTRPEFMVNLLAIDGASSSVAEDILDVLWRTAQGLDVLDASGAVIAPATSREAHAALPLIAGEGADRHVNEALDLVRAAGPLGARMRGLVRVGDRRWDVVLDREQRIQLPEEGPVQALERVIAMGQVHEMLERDLSVVDMRLSQRPTIRMNAAAVEQWRELQKTHAGIARP